MACVPETPTGNIVDPISENYDIPTPENFTVERLPNGNLQINLDKQSIFRVTGQELFLEYDGELKDDLKFDINATIGLAFIDAAFLEFPQTYAIRSYFEINKERIYSDYAYFTFEIENLNPSITFNNALNYVLYQPDFYNPNFRISVEYAPDSVNFEPVLSNSPPQKASLKLADFQTRFEGELDGVFRHKLKYLFSYESEYISTGSNRFSICDEQPSPTTSPTINTERVTLGSINYVRVNWDVISECYDEVFLYQRTNEDPDFKLISRHSKLKSNTLLLAEESRWVDIKAAGVRYGEGIVIESEVVRQNL
ncbi:MAG: hypothetical protein JJ895_10580 [Balneolaceae bacterium]|nr:hypothetical protein [Balneolaceae bacterium]